MEDIIGYLKSLRRDYAGKELDVNSVDENPFHQLNLWLEEAVNAKILDPNAMVVSSVGSDGMPSSRVVLMRGQTKSGIVFYTNYSSQKSKEIQSNPNVAVNFFWVELDRQIRIIGEVKKVSRKQSQEYFSSRPKDSQLAAIASSQSEVIGSRKELEHQFELLKEKYKNSSPQCPEDWGGFEVMVNKFEFWQGRPNRMHDRIIYTKKGDNWQIQRLAP